jgi:hypothetical protein
LLEPLTLRRARALAASYPAERADRIRELRAAAGRRAAAARALRHEEHDVGALALEREAAALAISAWLLARGEHDGARLDAAEAWARMGSPPDAPAALEQARPWLAAEDPLAFDALSPRDARRARAATARALGWLLEQTELRTPRQVRWARVLRISGTLVAVAAAVALYLWLFVLPWNVAAHKPVVESSHRGGVAPATVLTDGERDRGYTGTVHQEHPWVRVDLLDPFVIWRVVAYARTGCAAPVVIELSDDDRTWTEVGRAGISGQKRWQLDFPRRRARYVRLRHPGAGMLTLSELEVIGRRP